MGCKYKDKFMSSNICLTNFDTWNFLYKCDECGKEMQFKYMYNVYCSDECCFYHKYICRKCMEKRNYE